MIIQLARADDRRFPRQVYGTLVAGSAQYVLKLFVGGVLQDTRAVPITLTGP